MGERGLMTTPTVTPGDAATSTKPTSDSPAASVEGLTKRYGDHTVVDNLDLTLPTGVVAGLIGPNGAGKTTTMAMLLGLVRPSSGTATVLGETIAHPDRY